MSKIWLTDCGEVASAGVTKISFAFAELFGSYGNLELSRGWEVIDLKRAGC